MRSFAASLVFFAALAPPARAQENITVQGTFNPAIAAMLGGPTASPPPPVTSVQLGKLKLEANVSGVPIAGCVANPTNLVCQFPLKGAGGLVYTLYDRDGKKLSA